MEELTQTGGSGETKGGRIGELKQATIPASAPAVGELVRRPMIQISQPSLGYEEWMAVREPLTTGWLTQGPLVRNFESSFADRHQVKHALAVTSCTTGLHLILAAMGIGPGDEVIVPAFTWVATANIVLYCGAKPVLVDIDPLTFNISPEAVARALTPQTRAIIAVHLFGLAADMEALRAVANHIPIIEDAACAAGASYKGVAVGSLGRAAAFSFHPRKSITTGEGGMVTTHDDALAATMTQMRNHGATISEEERHNGPKPYLLPDFNLLGFNYRMTDLQGAVGLVQLKKLDRFIDERNEWAGFYSRELKDIPWLRCPAAPEHSRHGWQAYVTMVDETKAPLPRNDIMRYLQKSQISTRPGTHTIHELNYYCARFGFKADDFPEAHRAAHGSMALPLHNKMVAADYEYIVSCLRRLA